MNGKLISRAYSITATGVSIWKPFIAIRKSFCTFVSNDLEGLLDTHEQFREEKCNQKISIEDFNFGNISPISETRNLVAGANASEANQIAQTILLHGDIFEVETQKILRKYREKLRHSLVAEVLHAVKVPDLSVKFFIWAGRQVGYKHNSRVYEALIDIIESKSEDNRIPEHFLQEIKEDDDEYLSSLLNYVIRRYCHNGLWNVALEEMGRLKDFRHKPSRSTYNALIQVFSRAGRLDTAYLIHNEMLEHGYSMDEHTLGCFLHSICKEGKSSDAFSLLEKGNYVPNTIIFTRMISGLCDALLFEEAIGLLNIMRANSCIPNLVTYRVLIAKCLMKRKLGTCKRVLKTMIAEGCYPNSSLFTSLVHAYCRASDYAYAYKLINTMKKTKCRSYYIAYNTLIGSICGNPELPDKEAVELAEKAYDEMLELGVVLNKVNVVNYVWCLSGIGKFEKGYKVINQMMSKGFVPDGGTYSKIIELMCKSSKVEKALILFEEMKKKGMVPDVHLYTTMIDTFCKVGLVVQAQRWLDEMETCGCAPNVVTYTTLMHGYFKAKMVLRANEVFEIMLSKGCKPNIVTYSALIDGLCKAGDVEKAFRVYAKMKNNIDNKDVMDLYFKGVGGGDLERPNEYTYGALVDGMCKAHKVREARELLDVMSEAGCEPNHVIYGALIDGFCKDNKLGDAQQVFVKMIQRGYIPGVYNYSSLIANLFKDKRLDLVVKVLSKMLENSCAPNVIIYNQIIDGLCKLGNTDEARELMHMMEKKGCPPDVVSYTAMIDGYGKAGRVSEGIELFHEMGIKGCAPNFITYDVLIHHCCARGMLDKAFGLLQEMKTTHWPCHMTGHCKVIKGFSTEFIATHGLLSELSMAHPTPVFPVYRILIDSFTKAGKLETALELHEELLSCSKPLGVHRDLYAPLIESLLLAGRYDKALELYTCMTSNGSVPEITTMVHLVKGMFRVGKWAEALQLTHSICQMEINWVQEDANH